MSYRTELTFHLGAAKEYTDVREHATLQAAADFLKREAQGHREVLAYINDHHVVVDSGGVWGHDGEVLCTNDVWHKLFATAEQRILSR